jgi:hypothetical protein
LSTGENNGLKTIAHLAYLAAAMKASNSSHRA